VAGRLPDEQVVNGRVALAKARLKVHAAAADAGPSAAALAAGAVRSRPWGGVAVALAAGVALGVGRGRVMRTLLAPAAAPLLTELAWTVLRSGVDAVRTKRAARAGSTLDTAAGHRGRS
jgi:hypothetical protein